MKKIFTTLALAAFAAVPMLAQEPLYLNYGSSYYGTPEESDADLQMTYDEASGSYSLTQTYSPTQTNKYMRFYQKNSAGDITWYGPQSVQRNIDLNSVNPFIFDTLEADRTSCFAISVLKNEVSEAEIEIEVTLPTQDYSESSNPDGVVSFTQVSGLDVTPSAIYVWGSAAGGRNNQVYATMTETSEGSGEYEVTFNLPAADFDPDDVMGGPSAYGFTFWLSTSNESMTKGIRFLAPMNDGVEGNEEDDPSYYTINLQNGQTYTTTLSSETGGHTSMNCVTPGEVTFKFNYNTMAFSATMVSALNKVTLVVNGAGSTSIYKLLTINDNLNNEVFNMQVNPKDYFYSGSFELTFTPQIGYNIEVAGGAGVTVENDGAGVYTATGSAEANNSTITITVTEDEDITIRTVVLDFTRVASITEPAWSCVTVTGTGVNGGSIPNGLSIDKNTYSLVFEPDVELTFAPVESESEYFISSITSNNVLGVTIVEPEEEHGVWVVTLTSDVIDGTLLTIKVDGETVGVNKLGKDNAAEEIYNLQGVRVDRGNLTPGLYIINGKKVVVK